MTRKDLQERYNIYGNNKEIFLYRKQGEYTYGCGYCGSISLVKGKATFNGKAYSTVEALDQALREWEDSLPYPVDTYNPMLRKGSMIEGQIIWYLTEKLKFKIDYGVWNTGYVKEIGPNLKLIITVEREFNTDYVIITSQYGDYSFTQKTDNTEQGISIISSIVNCQCLTMAKDLVDILAVCDKKISTEVNAYVKDNNNIFGLRQVDFRGLMIEKLESMLKQLKGNEVKN